LNKNSNVDLTTASGISLVIIAIAENLPYSAELAWVRPIALAFAPVLSGIITYFISDFVKKQNHLTDEQKQMLTSLNLQKKHIVKSFKDKYLNEQQKAEWQGKLNDNKNAIHEVYQLSITPK
jgi:ABC-type bacteriocin/lantibiotic exporter with double-glycine peptidase domain